MINVTQAFKNELANDNVKFVERLTITLKNGTVLNLTNEHIWNGGIEIEDAVSSDDNFDVGTAIINKGTFILNNIYNSFTSYDFTDAVVVPKLGLTINGVVEIVDRGKFTVGEASYNDSLITLECYDNMVKLEKQVPTGRFTYPLTIESVVNGICSSCSVTLATSSSTFPHRDFVLQTAPDSESYTYRELLSWIAQIIGCFARFDKDGKLELKWYDTDAIKENATVVQRARAHSISAIFSHSMSIDDVILTGLQIIIKKTGSLDSTSSDASDINVSDTIVERGTADYMVRIKYNPLITESNAATIADWLFAKLNGVAFRKANLSVQPNPTIEAGDVSYVTDRKGNEYKIVISKSVFTVGESQTIVSSAQTPVRNSLQRYTEQEKNYQLTLKRIEENKTAWERAVEELGEAVENANGLYYTAVTDETTQATTYYLHNKVNLAESDIQIMVSDVGITVTSNGTDETPTWFGLTVDGNFIANLLSAHGINADWIDAGSITIQDTNGNETFYANTQTGEVRISADSLRVAADAISVGGKSVNTIASEAAAGAVTDAKSYVDAKMSGIETNLLKDSLGLTTDYWTFTGTVTRNQTDPFNGTNAILLQPNSGGYGNMYSKYTNNNPFKSLGSRYKFSVWLKASASSSNTINIYIGGSISKTIQPTTSWKKYTVEGLVTSSAVTAVSVGGSSSFSSSDGYNLYIYNPVCEFTFSAEEIYKAVSDDDTTRGWWIVDNKLYISMDYLQGGVAKFGNSNHGKGSVQIYDDNDKLIGTIDSTGIKYAGSGSSGNNLSNIYTKFDNQGITGFYLDKANGRLDLSNGTLVSLRYYSTSATGILICAQENTQQSSIAKFEKTFITFYTNYTGYNSDRRLKTNFANADFDIIDKLKTLSYDWKDTGNHVSVGLVAQDVQEVFPELVLEDEKGILSINYIGIIPHLVHKVQQQQKQINDLEARLSALERRLNSNG